LNRKRRNIH